MLETFLLRSSCWTHTSLMAIVGWMAGRSNYDKLVWKWVSELFWIRALSPQQEWCFCLAELVQGPLFSDLSVIPCSCPLDSTIQNLPSQFELFAGSTKTQRSSPATSFQGWRNWGPDGEYCEFLSVPVGPNFVVLSEFLPSFSLVSKPTLSLQMYHPNSDPGVLSL